ncbi:MAG: asparagine synthetase B family protein [Geminicoccaceae bacterium]
MVHGLGDFVVARFQASEAPWSCLVAGWTWPTLGGGAPSVETHDVSSTLKAAVSGDASVLIEGGHVRVALEQSLGGADPDAVLAGRIDGYRGKFARVEIDEGGESFLAFTDPMRQIPLFLLETPGLVAVATDLRLLTQLPGWEPSVSSQAIYHHLNFSYIPTPFTIFEQVRKLPPGARLTADAEGVRIERYWRPAYPEDLAGGEDDLAERLRQQMETSIGGYASSDAEAACFLSGGTDSSTIAGILAKTAGAKRTHAFSIGFAEEAFDELDYARTAAKAFGIQHHERRIGAEETLAAIDILVEAFDEPFGNSSAVPTYYCADLAHGLGHDCLLGGDGGDEIFGGNERYAKDYYFQRYYDLPGPVKAAGGMLRASLRPVDQRFANRIKNFLHRGALANPERFYTDDSFASDYYQELLTPTFREQCPKRSSLAILDRHFAEADAKADLNRLMYIDLQMAIADNDLTKVNRSTKAAGVSVLYPYLAPELIAFMGRVPVELKVKRTAKRYLFKKAVASILPDAILTKKKQGFGLPFGHWFRHDPKISAFLRDILMSQRCRERGYLESGFLTTLLDRHQQGVWDYSNELWLLLMLELWHQRFVDGPAVRRHAA